MSTSLDEQRKISTSVSVRQENPLDFLRIIYGMLYYITEYAVNMYKFLFPF